MMIVHVSRWYENGLVCGAYVMKKVQELERCSKGRGRDRIRGNSNLSKQGIVRHWQI